MTRDIRVIDSIAFAIMRLDSSYLKWIDIFFHFLTRNKVSHQITPGEDI